MVQNARNSSIIFYWSPTDYQLVAAINKSIETSRNSVRNIKETAMQTIQFHLIDRLTLLMMIARNS